MRRLKNLVTGACVALAAVLLSLHVRSFWVSDEVTLARDHGGTEGVRLYRGTLVLRHIDPEPGQRVDPGRPRVSRRTEPVDLPWPPTWACRFRTYGTTRAWGPFGLTVVTPVDVQAAWANVRAAEQARDAGIRLIEADLRRRNAELELPQPRWGPRRTGPPCSLDADQRIAEVERELAEARRRLARLTAEQSRTLAADGLSRRWQLIVPLWAPIALFSLPPALRFAAGWRRRRRAHRRTAAGLCVTCGYALRHLPSDRCPECGTPVSRRARTGLDTQIGAWVYP